MELADLQTRESRAIEAVATALYRRCGTSPSFCFARMPAGWSRSTRTMAAAQDPTLVRSAGASVPDWRLEDPAALDWLGFD